MLETVKAEINAILPKDKKNHSFKIVWDLFYYTRLFKYVHVSQYRKIRARFSYITAQAKMDYLCELGYMMRFKDGVYSAKDKVIPILKEMGYLTEILPPEPRGFGDTNELKNTVTFIQALKVPHFSTLLYPCFGKQKTYLIPDALMVLKDEENRRYKLTFLEVEAEKPQWNSNWIEDKRDNYLKLAATSEFYDYWTDICPLFDFPKPDISELKFSVSFVGNIKKDFGRGFSFLTHL
jgi:hypothetical protein